MPTVFPISKVLLRPVEKLVGRFWAEVKDLQSRIDRGDFDGGNKDDAPGGAASNQDAQRGGQYG